MLLLEKKTSARDFSASKSFSNIFYSFI